MSDRPAWVTVEEASPLFTAGRPYCVLKWSDAETPEPWLLNDRGTKTWLLRRGAWAASAAPRPDIRAAYRARCARQD